MAYLLVAFGCGGSVAPSAFDSGTPDVGISPDASGADAQWGSSGGAWSPVCPDSTPAIGSPCTQENLQCEYGNAWWDVACDTVVQCLQGSWSVAEPAGTVCQPEPGPNSTLCPSNSTLIADGVSCPDAGLLCVYGEGVFCSCQAP